MSLGLQLLRSIVDAGGQMALRQCRPAWFTPEETPVYEFLVAHIGRHGRLPAFETLRSRNMHLPAAHEPPEYYLAQVRDRAIFLQLQSGVPELTRAVGRRDMPEAIALLRQTLANASAVNPSRDVSTIQEIGQQVLEEYDRAHNTHSLLGCPLGWECVDLVTDGGQPGDVVVLVGRPGVGKTQALLWVVRRAWVTGRSIMLCSMEMGNVPIGRRIVGMQSGLNPRNIRSGRLSSWGNDMMHRTIDAFDDMPPFHVMSGNFRKHVSDVGKLADELSPDLIVVDAGYLLTPDKKSQKAGRREDIANVIEELKAVAIDRQRPLLTSVQFNREVKRAHRGDMDLSQIAEADAIGQVASIVLGMRRGDTPYEITRRRIEMLKNREGIDNMKFECNFGFAPIDMSFTRYIVDEAEEAAASRPDTRHMI